MQEKLFLKTCPPWNGISIVFLLGHLIAFISLVALFVVVNVFAMRNSLGDNCGHRIVSCCSLATFDMLLVATVHPLVRSCTTYCGSFSISEHGIVVKYSLRLIQKYTWSDILRIDIVEATFTRHVQAPVICCHIHNAYKRRGVLNKMLWGERGIRIIQQKRSVRKTQNIESLLNTHGCIVLAYEKQLYEDLQKFVHQGK